jgi:transposase
MSAEPPIPAELWDTVPPAARAALSAVWQALQQQLADLRIRVADLEARRGQNSSNSSLPPSANPPGAPPPAPKKPSGRRPGAQPGHTGHQRRRLSPERLRHVIALIPSHCDRCQAPLPQQPGPDDPEPTWHQYAELPKVAAVVTEYQGHARTCPHCGHVSREAIPAQIRAAAFGPRLTAVVSYLGGCQHVSQRGLEEVVETVFGVPLALGSVAVLQQQTSQALAPAYQQITTAVQAAPVKNVDETGWKQAGLRRWLWAAVTGAATLFLIHARRGAAGLRALLGQEPVGLIGSDRWSAYQIIPLLRRQVCWAHLKRDFQAMVDRGGRGAAVGARLLEQTRVVFGLWYRVRDGTRSRQWLLRQLELRVRPEVQALLQEGAACGCARTAGVCAAILKVELGLWLFARWDGLAPTNNGAERALRPAVLWRKGCFGSDSEGGCRFVERLLSVAATLRQQGRAVLDYLVAAISAHRHGLPAPKLLPTA